MIVLQYQLVKSIYFVFSTEHEICLLEVYFEISDFVLMFFFIAFILIFFFVSGQLFYLKNMAGQ